MVIKGGGTQSGRERSHKRKPALIILGGSRANMMGGGIGTKRKKMSRLEKSEKHPRRVSRTNKTGGVGKKTGKFVGVVEGHMT